MLNGHIFKIEFYDPWVSKLDRQLPQWYSLLDYVCPICNSINPVDIILGIVGRDEKISQVKKIMEIQRNGDSSKTETSLQVRVGN